MTKTAEEILKSKLSVTKWNFLEHVLHSGEVYKEVLDSMEEYASPLKKRIKELEAIAPEIFSTLIAIEAEISVNNEEISALKRSWRTLDMIYKLLHPSTNGKQD